MTDWVYLIQSLGFPIFICVWFMFRLEKILKAHTDICAKHTEVTQALIEKMKGGKYNDRK